MSAAMLAALLRNPARASTLDAESWSGVLTAARTERLVGSLAFRLEGQSVPDRVTAILADARCDAERESRGTLWEVDQMMATLSPLGCPVVLLKGAAFVAAGVMAGQGRAVGDLDILVPRDRLDDVERALIDAGWEWVKDDPYDQSYYRKWMHELPPLVHDERERMLDVHHTILPLTARPRPDAAALVGDSVVLPGGARVLSRADMMVHGAAHLLADGDLAGGLRNLWDIHMLAGGSEGVSRDWDIVMARARHHELSGPMMRAARLCHHLFGTPVPWPFRRLRKADRLFAARILARDGWGRETRPLLRSAFYIRSHWLRMPPLMLARHLLTKWRKGRQTAA
jgi:hypothetical protein